MNVIRIDGSQGEGGGQILRTSLTLSMITGQPFEITGIRAGRKNPGLLRQHQMAVQAAAAISGATVTGAELGSTTLTFAPGKVVGGEYAFDIGTAGSVTLVLQTVMLALALADNGETSIVTITGGTHNPKAPPVDFLSDTYCALLARLGIEAEVKLERYGFYPRGGGRIVATIKPAKQVLVREFQAPMVLTDRGPLIGVHVQAIVAGAGAAGAVSQLARIISDLTSDGLAPTGEVVEIDKGQGPGSVVMVRVQHQYVTEVFSAVIQRGDAGEQSASVVVAEVREYLQGGVAVCEHLADQLLLPIALVGGGSFTTGRVTDHASTNSVIILHFLPVQITWETGRDGASTVVVHKP